MSVKCLLNVNIELHYINGCIFFIYNVCEMPAKCQIAIFFTN